MGSLLQNFEDYISSFENNYLAIVSSRYLLPFVKGRERTLPKWALRGGMQNSQ